MPVVPIYERRVNEQVGPSTRHTTQATAANFGGNDIKAFGDLTKDVVKVAVEEENKALKALARDTLIKAQASADTALFGDGTDKSYGIYQRKGKDVVNVHDDFKKTYEDIKKSSMTALSDPRAKEMFSASFDAYYETNARSIKSFQSKEIEKYNQDTMLAHSGLLADNAVKNRNNPEVVTNNLLEIKANLSEVYKGQGADVIALKKQEATDAYHSNVVDAFLRDGDALGAQEYIKAHGEEMSGSQQAVYKEKTSKQVDEEWVLSNAIAYSNSGKPIEVQLKEIDNITGKDANVITALRESVKGRYNEKKAIQEQNYKDMATSVWRELMKNPNYKIPYSSLKEDDFNAMKKFQETAKSGFPEETDYTVLVKFAQLTDNDLKGMTSSDIMSYRSGLNKSDFDKALTKWSNVQTGKTNTDSYLTQVQSDSKMIMNTLEGIKKDKNENVVNSFGKAYQIELQNAETTKGSKLTPVEKQELMDRMIITGRTRGGGFGRYDFGHGTSGKKKKVVVPQADREKIVKALKQLNKPTTEADIQSAYEQKLELTSGR